MIRVDFHCHTCFSKDSLSRPKALLQQARKLKLDRVVITDHNTIQGALEAQRLDPQTFIVGEEIQTTQGEILAAFVSEEVPSGLSPEETIRRLRDQDAFISVSHPFDRYRSGAWGPDGLVAIAGMVDAIETFNSRCVESDFNRKAQAFANEYNLPGTAGSDAHAVFELGRGVLLLQPFSSADDLRYAIRSAQAETHLSSPWVHFTSTWAKTVKNLVAAIKQV